MIMREECATPFGVESFFNTFATINIEPLRGFFYLFYHRIFNNSVGIPYL